ncbi:MAG TPA: GNAT family N-acetyltransferase [Bauldia sp.]|nr:GNAT family N-acetyltransferase [Bauldia sp.]
MADRSDVSVRRVVDEADRAHVLAVLGATYLAEKRWISNPESQFPQGDIAKDHIAWFVAAAEGEPVGVVRILYDPPIAAYAGYGFTSLDPSIRIDDFIDRAGIAEVGRFAVVPHCRRRFMIAAALMRAATIDSLKRRVTHLITDVFEDDPHSPLGFHTRVVGFRAVATHDVGELNSASRRITLVLDVNAAREELSRRNNWFYRYIMSALPRALHAQLAA